MKSVSTRKERKLEDRLTNEILDCFLGKGSTIAKKQSLYELILVNRPFLHLLRYK
jgi:ribosomal protein S7